MSSQPELMHIGVLPVSVIDIAPQGFRSNEHHASQSSRANHSGFPKEIADLCFEFFMRGRTLVFDPFAGWGERADAARRFGVNYIGFDSSPKAIARANESYGIENVLADSLTSPLPANYDGVVTCPPYWNLERYAASTGLDRERTWEGFLAKYRAIMSRCYEGASTGSVFCVMVGDWRANHRYYDLEWETCAIFKKLGAVVRDKVVVSRKNTSKIKILLPQCKRLGYTARVHENLLVFTKPAGALV